MPAVFDCLTGRFPFWETVYRMPRFRASRLLLLSRQFNGSGCGVLQHPFAYVQDVSFWNPLRRLSAFVSKGCISPLLAKYIFQFVGKCAFIPTCGHKGDVILTAPASQKGERNVHRMPACTVLLFWQSGIHGQALYVHAVCWHKGGSVSPPCQN